MRVCVSNRLQVIYFQTTYSCIQRLREIHRVCMCLWRMVDELMCWWKNDHQWKYFLCIYMIYDYIILSQRTLDSEYRVCLLFLLL